MEDRKQQAFYVESLDQTCLRPILVGERVYSEQTIDMKTEKKVASQDATLVPLDRSLLPLPENPKKAPPPPPPHKKQKKKKKKKKTSC